MNRLHLFLALICVAALGVPLDARANVITRGAARPEAGAGQDDAQEHQRRGDRDRHRAGRQHGDDDEDDDERDEHEGDDDRKDRRHAGRNVCVDRNNDGMCDDRNRRADRCVDRDGDGFCDAQRRNDDDFCVDQNADNRCDTGGYPARYPNTLPEMIGTVLINQGRRTSDVNRWIGGSRVRVRYVDADGNRVPERVSFLTPAGQVLQTWIDTSGDGRADRVEVYRNGRQVRVITP